MALLQLMLAAATASAAAAASPLTIEKLGTADFSMVETTPVVWKGKLLRFESVRGNYGSEPNCPTCGLGHRDPAMGKDAYYRFRDVATLDVTPSFAPGYSFGCAFVQEGKARADGVDTMWYAADARCCLPPRHAASAGVRVRSHACVRVRARACMGTKYMPPTRALFRCLRDSRVRCVCARVGAGLREGRAFGRGSNTTKIAAFWSTDLKTWKQGPGLQLAGFGFDANSYTAFNNNVHDARAPNSHIMAIELGSPRDITGSPFTSVGDGVHGAHGAHTELLTGTTVVCRTPPAPVPGRARAPARVLRATRQTRFAHGTARTRPRLA